MVATTKWNEAKIRKLLNESNTAVERAIVAIFDRQTADEKATSDTRHTNRRGFSACHAKRGSYYGRWVKSGKRLTGDHLTKAREIALHYVSQLLDIATTKTVKSPAAVPAQTTKCPDGCCGGEEEEDGRERYKGALEAHDVERGMQAMEAIGDRLQTKREEMAKHQARMVLEHTRCLKKVNRNLPCFCVDCAPDAPPPDGET